MSEHVLSILVKALGTGTAAKELKGVDSAVSKIGTTAYKGRAALSHFGGVLGGLAGPLGFAGLAGAALSVTGAMEQGIEKVDTMALAVEKLTGVTGLGVHEASQLTAVFEKFGIEGDRVIQIAGFAEKTLGKLNVTTGKGAAAVNKLAKLEKLYGITLHDATGKVVDFGTELGIVANYYNSNHTASQKAALAATLLGKGYTALIPVLKLGAKGIHEAEVEADKLGLTLKNAQDVKNVHDFIAAQREAKDSIAGLEVQIGLLVMPDLTGALRGLTGFIATHKDQIKQFFADGLKVAEGLGSFIGGTLIPDISSVAGTLTHAWNAIPAPLRDMLVKGAIADRTMKFLFGFSPIHTIVDIAENSLGKALGSLIGKNIVQPVFVTNQIPGGGGIAEGAGGGLLAGLGSMITKAVGLGLAAAGIAGISAGTGAGGPTGAAVAAGGAAAGIGGAAILLGPIGAMAASIGAVALTLVQIRDNDAHQAADIATSVGNQITGGAKLADLRTSLAAVNQGINDIQANPLNVLVAGDALDQLKAQRATLQQSIDRASADAHFLANDINAGTVRQAAALGLVQRGIDDDKAATIGALDRVHKVFVDGVKLDPSQVIDVREKTGALALIKRGVDNDRAATVAAINATAVKLAGTAMAAGAVAKSGGLAAAHAINAKRLSLSITNHNQVGVTAYVSNRESNHVQVTTARAYSTVSGAPVAS